MAVRGTRSVSRYGWNHAATQWRIPQRSVSRGRRFCGGRARIQADGAAGDSVTKPAGFALNETAAGMRTPLGNSSRLVVDVDFFIVNVFAAQALLTLSLAIAIHVTFALVARFDQR